jgi:hypothetical protein
MGSDHGRESGSAEDQSGSADDSDPDGGSDPSDADCGEVGRGDGDHGSEPRVRLGRGEPSWGRPPQWAALIMRDWGGPG